MKQKVLKLMCLLCVGMMSMSAWAVDYETLFTIASGSVVSGTGYKAHSATVEDRSFVITFGGNNSSVGTNSSNRSNCNLSSYSKYAVSPVTTSSVASAFACTTRLDDVSKISYTVSGSGSNQASTKVYLLYSADNTTFSQLPLTSGTQGSTIVTGSVETAFEFSPKSGYFALLFEATNSSGNWRIDNVSVSFYKNKELGVATTTTIDESGITNTDIFGGTAAGSLSASVTAAGTPVGGASVTWSGDNDEVATIDASGVVTLVAAGTVTFTASYAGVTDEYKASSDTYEMTVINTTPSISFDITKKTLEEGDSFTKTATTLNTGGAAVSYTSSNVSVVTVNSSTGEITAIGFGTATITASVTVSATEYTATYDVTVTKPAAAGMYFYESFDSNEGTGGNDGSWSGTIASADFEADNTWDVENAYGADQCAKFGTGKNQGTATTPALGITGNAILTFKAAAWNAKDETTTLNLSASAGVTLDKSSVTLVKGEWTEYSVKVTGLTGTSTITFAAANTSNNRFFLDEVKVVAIIGTVAVSESGYATYYNSTYDYKLPEGLTGYTAINPSAGKITLKPEYEAGDVVPAGEALVLKGAEGSYDLVYNASATSPIAENLLKGTDAAAATTGGDKYYKLSYDSDGNNLGFYWATADGAAFTNGAHKAYLALTDAQASSVKGFRLDFDEATGITELTEKTEGTEGIYNLNGQRLNGVQKGINIVNGKKVLVK